MPLDTQVNHVDYTYTEPDGWNFAGADWANPDPGNCDYWRALAWAIMERQEAAGTLSRASAELLDPNPFFPLSAPVAAIRNAILDLVPHFFDFDAITANVENIPVSAAGDVGPGDWEVRYSARDVYNAHPGFARCPSEGATNEELAAFLRESMEILLTLRCVRWSGGFQYEVTRSGFDSESGPGTAMDAIEECMASADDEFSRHADESYGTVGGGIVIVGKSTQYAGETDDLNPFAQAACDRVATSARLVSDNAPPKTILGQPRAPWLRYVAASTKAWTILNGVEPPEELREYGSNQFMEGVYTATAPHNWVFAESAPYGETVVSPFGELSATSLGSQTRLYFYADWVPCYKFEAV